MTPDRIAGPFKPYFESLPHTAAGNTNYSFKCINLQVKIAPYKCTIYLFIHVFEYS